MPTLQRTSGGNYVLSRQRVLSFSLFLVSLLFTLDKVHYLGFGYIHLGNFREISCKSTEPLFRNFVHYFFCFAGASQRGARKKSVRTMGGKLSGRWLIPAESGENKWPGARSRRVFAPARSLYSYAFIY